MVWSATWPDITKSVKTNGPTGSANTTYIKTTMNVDHYWDNSDDNAGHHQWVQMTQSGTTGSPVDITLATGMEGGIYAKAKTSAESPDNQDVQPFYINNNTVENPAVTQVMQMLGMRACGLFSVAAGVVTENYIHNVSITRTATGQFTATFDSALPTDKYLVFGGALQASGTAMRFSLVGAASTKTTSLVKFYVIQDNLSSVITSVDPLQCWFVVFGG